jgi:hypothetical protein
MDPKGWLKQNLDEGTLLASGGPNLRADAEFVLRELTHHADNEVREKAQMLLRENFSR